MAFVPFHARIRYVGRKLIIEALELSEHVIDSSVVKKGRLALGHAGHRLSHDAAATGVRPQRPL